MGAGDTTRVSLLGLAVGALVSGSAEAAGNAKVFDIGSNLEPFKYTVMMTLVILGLVVFDFILEAFEEYLQHHKGRFHQRLLKKAIKELMILGTISFVLFILKDQAVYDQSDEVFTNTFNFVNLFLFFVGVSLVLAAVMLVLATAPLKSRWDSYANTDLKSLLEMHHETTSKSLKYYLAWLPRYFRGMRQAQVVEYHLFRSVFLRLNRSLLTPAFDFSKYSAAIVDELIVVFFDVGWASWLLAILVLFFTLPMTGDEDGSAQVSPQGAILFGVALLVLECLTCAYTHFAHRKVIARMGIVGGFTGVGKALERLWVEPLHHMDQETSAIDVKDLLAAAPVNAPTLEQLTSEVSASSRGASRAQVNFTTGRGSSAPSSAARTTGGNNNSTGSTHGVKGASASSEECMAPVAATAEATAAAATTAAAAAAAENPPCPPNGAGCTGCHACDALWLPPGSVQNCSMGGDAFVLGTIRPPLWVIDRLPQLLKGFSIKVGSYWWFKTLFGMGTLHKCYYSAFYWSYALGRATQASTANAVIWVVLTPLPLLLCLLPLAKRTLPLFAQLSCLQGQIVWEIVSDIEEKQEMAARAREKVLIKLQETLLMKLEGCNASAQIGTLAADPQNPASLRSRAMNDWFDEWDTDGDGQITRDELARGLQKLGLFLSLVQLKELFRLADPDHSKSIDLDEFRAFLSDLQSLESEPEQYQREVDLRVHRRSFMEEQSRSTRAEEFGLFAKSCSGHGGSVNTAGSHRGFNWPDRAVSMDRAVKFSKRVAPGEESERAVRDGGRFAMGSQGLTVPPPPPTRGAGDTDQAQSMPAGGYGDDLSAV